MSGATKLLFYHFTLWICGGMVYNVVPWLLDDKGVYSQTSILFKIWVLTHCCRWVECSLLAMHWMLLTQPRRAVCSRTSCEQVWCYLGVVPWWLAFKHKLLLFVIIVLLLCYGFSMNTQYTLFTDNIVKFHNKQK